ncbi:M1 family peptidase [bacterium]|nr:MAG: M1 family peptidase [bacterium]
MGRIVSSGTSPSCLVTSLSVFGGSLLDGGRIALILSGVITALSALLGMAFGPQGPIRGGDIEIERAAYDVLAYDVSIKADPVGKSFAGTTVIDAKTVIPTSSVLVDLSDEFAVSAVTDGRVPLRFERLKGQIRVHFSLAKQPGDPIRMDVTYAGIPHVARNAPWDGGVVWAKTPSGADWISVALQGPGADLIFPCKDHPSDRADRATMRLTVPDPLVAVGPGKLTKTVHHADKTSTYEWTMPLPINNYSLVFNAAPYELVKDSARSVAGQSIPIHFYVLPESRPNAARLIAEQKKYLAFMEKYCGPFPFRAVKIGIVETPHLGMEHSTSIAYGNKFRFAPDGLDWLLLHEFGHEWWANLVSCADTRDEWIHEGFQSYMDTLYLEATHDKAAYLAAMKDRRKKIRNERPVSPRPEVSPEPYGGDIYDKGALVLHSLRFLMGDEAFFRVLRRMAYPKPELEKQTDGRALRLATTEEFVNIASVEAKQDLSWFFEIYVRQAKLPTLKTEAVDGGVHLRWETSDGSVFPMPIEVLIGGKKVRVPMAGGRGIVEQAGSDFGIDPDGWVLRGADAPLSDSR